MKNKLNHFAQNGIVNTPYLGKKPAKKAHATYKVSYIYIEKYVYPQ